MKVNESEYELFICSVCLGFANFSNLQEIIPHKKYSAETNQNDIALIRLKEEIIPSFVVRPACLRADLGDEDSETTLIVSGWGSTSAESNLIS